MHPNVLNHRNGSGSGSRVSGSISSSGGRSGGSGSSDDSISISSYGCITFLYGSMQ